MSDLETRLNEWLRFERGIEMPRRIVQSGGDRIVVSRFDDGFFPRLQGSLARRPALFDPEAVRARYEAAAADSPATPRVDLWHEVMRGIVADGSASEPLSPEQQAEVMAGVDSVAAVMQAVLWSMPLAADAYAPEPGEADAFREASGRFTEGHDLFTREYGQFEGRRVVSFCPGVAYARRLLALAWVVCTGTEPPAR